MIKHGLNGWLSAAHVHHFHRKHAAQATTALRQIEQHRGPLHRAHRKLCNEYAYDVLGNSHYAPWLWVYAAFNQQFKEGWIPDNYYGAVVVPALKGAYGHIAALKPLNARLFNSPWFPDILCYVNGVFFDTHYRVIAPANVTRQLFEHDNEVIFKTDRSSQGRGIHFFDRTRFNLKHIQALGNGLFQSCIHQHETFAAFAPSAVATLRITTFIHPNGDVSIPACYLRLGSGQARHIQPLSTIKVAIDTNTGAFSATGYTPQWQAITHHPDSQRAFAGNTIPCFSQCINAVKQLHQKVPFTRCIGWDLVVDQKDAVNIMEWNGNHNDIKFSEAAQGPCFADLGWEKL